MVLELGGVASPLFFGAFACAWCSGGDGRLSTLLKLFIYPQLGVMGCAHSLWLCGLSRESAKLVVKPSAAQSHSRRAGAHELRAPDKRAQSAAHFGSFRVVLRRREVGWDERRLSRIRARPHFGGAEMWTCEGKSEEEKIASRDDKRRGETTRLPFHHGNRDVPAERMDFACFFSLPRSDAYKR